MLKEKYDINDDTRKSGTALGSKDVTLPRITGVLPSVAVRMFHMRVVKETVPFITIPGTTIDKSATSSRSPGLASSFDASGVSHAICCPFLHPRPEKSVTHIHGIMIYVVIKLGDIIHKKEKY